jgi:hypothetical protein
MNEVYAVWLCRIWAMFIGATITLTLAMTIEYIYGARMVKVWRDFKEVIQWARDRYWFYYVIDGDEFHPSLNLNMKKIMATGRNWEKIYNKEKDRIYRDRARAHKLDAIYNGYDRGMVL